MENINCILCDRPEEAPVAIRENGYLGRRCPHCGLIYISPRPSAAEIAEMYETGNAQIIPDGHVSGGLLQRVHARHTLGILKRFVQSGTLLEIGAGGGRFLDEARKAGFEVYGTEMNDLQIEFINRELGIPCQRGPIGTVFQGRKFDVIYHCDVISHFYNPLAEFRAMRERLSDKGILVFETGNLADIEARFLSAVPTFQYPDHLFFFGEKSLRMLLERSGLRVLTMRRYSIAAQLAMGNVVASVSGARRRVAAHRSPEYAAAPPSGRSIGWKIRNVLRSLVRLWYFCLRYKVGALLPKNGRPQTILVVAGKS